MYSMWLQNLQVCRAPIKLLYVCLQVLLTGVPLTAGLFTITGCQVTAMGVSWKQPWLPRSVFLGLSNGQQNGAKDQGGHAQVEMTCLVSSFSK